MINSVVYIPRYRYLVKTMEPKADNQYLNAADYLNVGYMAGRFGVNLINPNEPNIIQNNPNGVIFDINACTSELFEKNLNQAGIKFDRLA